MKASEARDITQNALCLDRPDVQSFLKGVYDDIKTVAQMNKEQACELAQKNFEDNLRRVGKVASKNSEVVDLIRRTRPEAKGISVISDADISLFYLVEEAEAECIIGELRRD